MSFYRVLPRPPSLSDGDIVGRPITRSTTNFFQHSISTSLASKDDSDQGAQSRNSSLSKSSITSGSERSGSLSNYVPSSGDETSISSGRKRSSSTIDSSTKPRTLPAAPLTTPFVQESGCPSQVCLCQPDPKVPRPRNAFILYRQHYQAAVAAQNPGLSNPEISKIIGEKWRQQPTEVKNEWKVLAEEEKIRHQQQYPDYRYQPRRHGRNHSATNPTTLTPLANYNEVHRCAKCGGRTMNTPNTPLSPYPASPNLPVPQAGAPSRFLPLMGASRPPPPHPPPGAGYPPARPPQVPQSAGMPGLLQLSGPRSAGDVAEQPAGFDSVVPLSPDLKRRRLNHGSYSGPRNYNPVNGPESPYPFPQNRRASLAVGEVSRGPPSAMGPPPRPRGPNLAHDPSLTLPPLKTATFPPPTCDSRVGVEAMIMAIPYLNKIKVLARISPPLPRPGLTSPAHEVRGAVIAIDGHKEGIAAVTKYLQERLAQDDYAVRLFQIAQEDCKPATLAECLADIQSWHAASKEIVKFITTRPDKHVSSTRGTEITASSSQSSTCPNAEDRNTTQTRAQERNRPISPEAVSPTSTPTSRHSKSPSPKAVATPPLIPVALIPFYQLSYSNSSACNVPITDSYAATDHWQWMATLWRGIVGPDVTIYVREAESEEMERFGAGTGVEIRLPDSRAIAIRKGKGCGIEERALRRVGFEVGEWIRGRRV